MIFDRLATAPPRADVAWTPYDDRWYQSSPSGTATLAGFPVDPDRSLRVSAVFACVSLIAETLASLPCILYRRLDNGGKERAKDHRLYRTVRYQPNSWQTTADFVGGGQVQAGLRGGTIAEIRERGRQVELVPIHPDRVWVEQLANGRLRYRVYDLQGPERVLLQDEVLHVRDLSLNGMDGLARSNLAREAIAVSAAGEAFVGGFFRNDATGRLVVSYPGSAVPPKEKRDEMREAIQANYGGWANRSKAMILYAGAQATEIGGTTDEGFIVDPRKFQVADIARFWRVPGFMIGLEEKSTSWGCLPGDTLVMTTTGPVPIGEVKAGDEVWSLGAKGLVRSKVLRQWMTDVRPVRVIETAGRQLRLTDNHKVFVRRFHAGGVVGPFQGTSHWYNTWIRADEIQVGDYLAVPHGLPALGTTSTPSGRPLTVELMELCGLYLGDGSLDGNRVEIAHERDPDYVEHYRAIVRREFGVEPYSDHRRTRFSSIEARHLLEGGFTGTAQTKRVPSWVFGLAPELIAGLLRGLVDSDGSIQRGRIVYSSCNRLLLEDVRQLSMQIGVPVGRVVVGRKAGTYVIRGRSGVQSIKYQLSCSSILHNATVGSNSARKGSHLVTSGDGDRRVTSYDEGWRGGLGRSVRPGLTPGGEWDLKNLKLQRVRRIREPDGLAVPVYDIAVEGTQSFIADGVLVHNSGIEQQKQGFVDFTIRPWLTRWEQSLARDLLTESEQEEFFFEFLLADLLRGDLKSRTESLSIQRSNGVISPNEWRALENMNARPGGDEYQESIQGAPANQPSRTADPVEDPEEDDEPAPTASRLGPMINDAAERLVAAEVRELEKRTARAAEDGLRFVAWVRQFYTGHHAYAVKTLRPLALAAGLAEAVATQVADRIQETALAAISHEGPPAGWTAGRADQVADLITTTFTVAALRRAA